MAVRGSGGGGRSGGGAGAGAQMMKLGSTMGLEAIESPASRKTRMRRPPSHLGLEREHADVPRSFKLGGGPVNGAKVTLRT